MTETAIDLETRLVAVDNLDAAEIEGETALFSVDKGAYFGLSPVGSRIFALLDGARSVGDVCALLQQEFQVTESQCREDTLAFLQDLARRGLVRQDGQAGRAFRDG